jgi:hypothetical protein
VPQALAPEHLGQVPPRLRVVALDEAEAFGGTVPRNTLAHDHDEVGLLLLPMPQVAAVEADRDRRRATRSVSRRTDVAFNIVSTGKNSRKALTVSPYETRDAHLLSRYSSSGAVCSGSSSTSGLMDAWPVRRHGHRRSRGLASSSLPNKVREDDGLPIFDTSRSAAVRAPHARSQERGDLAADDLALEFEQERLGLCQRHALVLEPLMVLVEHDAVVAELVLVIADNDELELEAQRHTGSPQRRRGPDTVSAHAWQPEANAPGLLWPPGQGASRTGVSPEEASRSHRHGLRGPAVLGGRRRGSVSTGAPPKSPMELCDTSACAA